MSNVMSSDEGARKFITGFSASPNAVTFSYTASAQTFVVPAGVTQLYVLLTGAQGGDILDLARGGKGGGLATAVTVVPGETLFVFVGGSGASVIAGTSAGAAGYNGGGDGAMATIGGGGGGGASDIRRVLSDITSRIVVGAGGGGAGVFKSGAKYVYANGGAGGVSAGSCGAWNATSGYGKGGTQDAGGKGGNIGSDSVAGDGALGKGGNAAVGSDGGGGGGGYYGGGGGASYGGGGGSSFTVGEILALLPGVTNGDGTVIIDYTQSTSPSTRPTATPSSKRTYAIFIIYSAY